MALQAQSCFDFLSISSVSLSTTEDETRTQILSIKKVTAEDLKRNYVCHARNAKGEVDKPAKVKQKGNGCAQQMSPWTPDVTLWRVRKKRKIEKAVLQRLAHLAYSKESKMNWKILKENFHLRENT